MENEIKQISIDLIDDPQVAMRSEINDDGIEELVASIKEIGLMQPITVRPIWEKSFSTDALNDDVLAPAIESETIRYEVIAGHRRLIAVRRSGIAKIACIVRDVNDREATVLKVHENLLRRDVNPVDEAIFLQSIIKSEGLSIKGVADMIKKSESYVREKLEILGYPDYLIEAIGNKQVGLGAARWLNKITDEKIRSSYVKYATQGGISVRRAIAWFRSWEIGNLPHDPVVYQEQNPETGEIEEVVQLECVICRGFSPLTEMILADAHADCVKKIQQ